MHNKTRLYTAYKKATVNINALLRTKMARFLKFKFLIIFKLNFNVGQFYEKILNFAVK